MLIYAILCAACNQCAPVFHVPLLKTSRNMAVILGADDIPTWSHEVIGEE